MRAITLLFILAISFNGITSWDFNDGKYEDYVIEFYLRTDRPLSIESVNTEHIMRLLEIIYVGHIRNYKTDIQNVSISDLELQSGCSIGEFTTKLFEKLDNLKGLFVNPEFQLLGFYEEVRDLIDMGKVGKDIDELVIAEGLIKLWRVKH